MDLVEMTVDKIKILLVDDDEDDYVITRDLLSEIGEMDFHLDWVGTYGTALEIISRAEHDVYLVDFGLGERNGLELLREALGRGCTAPIILLTGQGDHEIDIEAMKAGAADYLVKGQIAAPLLERSIRYAIERGQTLRALRNSEEHFRSLTENALDLISVIDLNRKIRYQSPSSERALGYSPEELVGKSIFDFVHPDDAECLSDALDLILGNPGHGYSVEFRFRHSDKGWRLLEAIGKTPANEWVAGGIVVNSRDITERKFLQQQLIQSEKLAALGKLISGFARELNNPLTSVIGYTQLVLSQHDLDPGLRERLDIISAEGERARRIVQNMLSFARQHKPGRAGVDLNTLLDMTLDLRTYEMGVCNIEVKREFGEIGEIIGDSHLLQQVFLNIIINAEQAMRDSGAGGKLLVRTEERAVDSRKWVKISIIDDGPGMPEEIASKVFDPFFTTKNVGEGTGLGLSISYGIIKEHGGSIKVESTTGRGSAFVIELPCQPDHVQSCSLA